MPGRQFAILMLLLWPFVAPPTVLRIAVSTSPCPLTLRCELRGEFLNLRWLRDGRPLPEDQRISFNETNQTMHVSCLNASDWGKYTCQVSNAAGTSEVHVNITSDLGTGKGTGEKENDLLLILCCTGGTLIAILTLCIILFYTCKCDCRRTGPTERRRGQRRTDDIAVEERIYDEPIFQQQEAPDPPRVDLLPYVYTDFIKLKAQQAVNTEEPSEDFGYSTIPELKMNIQPLHTPT
ncbi:hypothetical protein AOLI_G00223750 [Acnodon oligacanthus]